MIVGNTKKRHVSKTREVEPAQPAAAESNEQFILNSIQNRDYSAAATFISFLRDELKQPYTKELALWHGYSLFHSGQYEEAIQCYENLLKDDPSETILYLYISSCYFYEGDYETSKSFAEKGPKCDLQTRLLFHIAQQMKDDELLQKSHSTLLGTLENQLSLAAMHYVRSHYDFAIDIYQKILLEHPEYIALNVYIAMCQFKLDNFEESNASVDQYLAENSDSAVALNLKSCDYLRLFGSDVAESQILQIRKFSSASYSFVDALVEHNLCVFKEGEDGLAVFPKLISGIGEAKQNLARLLLMRSEAAEAFELLKDLDPFDVPQSLIKIAVLLEAGQQQSDQGMIELANQLLQDVLDREEIVNTVPGRQALATTKFISGDMDEALRVLDTIEHVCGEVDEFLYNKAMTLASLSRWQEAEKYFLKVKNASYKAEVYYTTWLARCYIKNKKPEEAWALYTNTLSAEDAKQLLYVIATECFTSGFFYYSMSSYDILSKYELDRTLKEGMIASAVGVFRQILAQKETEDKLGEVLSVLASEPEASSVLETIQNYLSKNEEADMP